MRSLTASRLSRQLILRSQNQHMKTLAYATICAVTSVASGFAVAPFQLHARSAGISGVGATPPQIGRRSLSTKALNFKQGDPILIEVISFGPIGASVDIVGDSHDEKTMIAENDYALGQGLVLQSEIQYFRQGRDNIDVIVGEILPAYVEERRVEDGRYHIALRPVGGKAKAMQLSDLILQRLSESGGEIPVGDKSTPDDIAQEFPGVSKGTFKKTVSMLYKAKKVQPGPYSVTLMQ